MISVVLENNFRNPTFFLSNRFHGVLINIKPAEPICDIRPDIRSGIPLRRSNTPEKKYLHTYKRYLRNRIRFFRPVSAVILLSSEKCENTGSTSGVRCFRFISPISLKRFSLILILCRSRLWLRSTILLPLALKQVPCTGQPLEF